MKTAQWICKQRMDAMCNISLLHIEKKHDKITVAFRVFSKHLCKSVIQVSLIKVLWVWIYKLKFQNVIYWPYYIYNLNVKKSNKKS